MKRKRLSPGHSKAMFTNTAKRTHPKNLRSNPARGGIRL